MARLIVDLSEVREQELLDQVNVSLREVRLLSSRDPMVMEAAKTARIVRARALEDGMFSFLIRTEVRGVSGKHFLKVLDWVSIIPFGDPDLEVALGKDLLSVTARDVVTAIRESTVRDVLGW